MNFLKKARLLAELNQQELAKRAGVSVITVSLAENGAAVSSKTFASLCQVLNIPEEEAAKHIPVCDPIDRLIAYNHGRKGQKRGKIKKNKPAD